MVPGLYKGSKNYGYFADYASHYIHAPRDMTIEEIEADEKSCVESVAMAIALGFDGIEIHTGLRFGKIRIVGKAAPATGRPNCIYVMSFRGCIEGNTIKNGGAMVGTRGGVGHNQRVVYGGVMRGYGFLGISQRLKAQQIGKADALT
jgi:hypothetical protein